MSPPHFITVAKMKMEVAMDRLLSLFSPYLLLLLLSFSYCCHVSSQSTVRYLPGFNGPLPFHMETGSAKYSPTFSYQYVGVGDMNEDQLFYFFMESETNPKEDPLMMWLTGGPGCSASSGLLYEIGMLPPF
ncbi:serine carboxypeptidase-like protein 15 isoform X1 [Cinnamomum micranthum f. kanehirae]|uniref:Serine carboxypeptidase-like protein 15 isoform X1 n=1 Tax=Cinnamomum micranthum f. kanehirae TaxID=337451 RepID=A0A443NVF0_9MAGN|nr:serine carboxypeptidase-like protein 15 isoform X1 [Cinnamomum micranthum f. kanehirae]